MDKMNGGGRLKTRSVLVTGGAGFIGSHFVRRWAAEERGPILNLDLLTYAGDLRRLAVVQNDDYTFLQGDVSDRKAVERAFELSDPSLIVHFAAESHVTRSEKDPSLFYRTNVEGTETLLRAAEEHGVSRFVHISTDEVYGPIIVGSFKEEDKDPGADAATSAYSKSKSLADDLARSYSSSDRIVVVRPTNCFGPWQHPEKALPRWITRCLTGRPVLVWGDGLYTRQWLHVDDLVNALLLLLDTPSVAGVYNIGPRHDPEITNAALARWLVSYLGGTKESLLFTEYDRPNHDRRYSVDAGRLEALGWKGGSLWDRMAETVEWYRGARAWWEALLQEAERIYGDES
jgi:dTDP-glucose 4,6-dehydratase